MKRDIPKMTIHGDNKNWVSKDSSYPTGNHNGYGGNGSGGGSMNYGKDKWGCAISNTPKVSSAINSSVLDSSSARATFNSIIKVTSSPQHGNYLIGERIINLHNGNFTDGDMGVLVQYLQYQGLNLGKFDVSYNQLSKLGVENLFYTFSLQRSHTALYNIKFMNLSNNQIGDDGAKYIAAHLSAGQHPNLKALDLSGNQISNTGSGYIAEGMKSINQGLTVTLAKVQGFSKDALKSSLKSILTLNKQNGISANEMFTTEESLEHCKKAIGNVSLNITIGVAKCKKTPLKYSMPKDLTLQDVAIDILSQNKTLKPILSFVCIAQESFFSVVDEDFSQCLVGLESMINE